MTDLNIDEQLGYAWRTERDLGGRGLDQGAGY